MFILPINNISNEERDLVGVKAASLGVLAANQIAVPDGFVVTTEMMEEFFLRNHLWEEIRKELNFLDRQNPQSCEQASIIIKKMIKAKALERKFSDPIFDAYEKLGKKETLVALRASLNSTNYSSGIFPLFLNIKGETTVAELIKEMWASQFNPVFIKENKNPTQAQMAVIVQRMIEAETSGFVYTISKQTGDKTVIEIEAVMGNGEVLSSKKVEPDTYVLDKKSLELISKIDRNQEFCLELKNDQIVTKKLNDEDLTKELLSEQQLKILSEMACRIDRVSYYPQSLEWVMYHDQFYFLQTQDLVVSDILEIKENNRQEIDLDLEIIARGIGVKGGISSGRVQFIKDKSDSNLIDNGEIVVCEKLNQSMMKIFDKAKALIIERGEIGDENWLLARELDLPVIIRVENACKLLRNGQVITVDGNNGFIYGGGLDTRSKDLGFSRQEFWAEEEAKKVVKMPKIKTATKIYLDNIADGKAKIFENLEIDGIACLSGEKIIASLGIHPKQLIYDKKEKLIKTVIADKVKQACSQFEGEIFYKISDHQNNCYHRLKNGSDWEVEEENKLLGLRGGIRHIIDEKLLRVEIETLAKVYKKHKNLTLVMPFLRTISEWEILKNQINKTDYSGQLWLWAGSASNLILLPEFVKRGADGVIIDLEHLAKLMIGVDSENQEVARVFSPMDSSVLWLIERANRYANEQNLPCILTSKYAGIYSEFVDRMVAVGVDGFSVPFELVNSTRMLTSKAEGKIIVND